MSLKRTIKKDLNLHSEGDLNLSADENHFINLKSPLKVEPELKEGVRTDLGLKINQDIQAFSEKLNDISTGTYQEGDGIIFKNGKFEPVNISALNERVQNIENYLSIFTQTYTITDSNSNIISFDFT